MGCKKLTEINQKLTKFTTFEAVFTHEIVNMVNIPQNKTVNMWNNLIHTFRPYIRIIHILFW